ncbi:MAG: hypothetical protein HY858_13550 [Candidatus Solibacter usitatus]|nr:hypothetical protein [Candidatus Solibacter usitatus]
MPFRSRRSVLALACLAVAGCGVNWSDDSRTPGGRPGPVVRDKVVIEKEKAARAELVQVDLTMGAGELDVRGGAAGLLEAEFAYNIPSWKPEVRYDDSSFRGRLSIRQPKGDTTIGDVKNEWKLRLANSIPLDIAVRCGAGENRLDLRDLKLRSVEIHLGAGTVDLDLRGKPEKDYDVSIHGGVGEATVRVPSAAGVVAEARGGIGSIEVRGMKKDGSRWVNDAYGKSKTTIRLDVKGGIGQINIFGG